MAQPCPRLAHVLLLCDVMWSVEKGKPQLEPHFFFFFFAFYQHKISWGLFRAAVQLSRAAAVPKLRNHHREPGDVRPHPRGEGAVEGGGRGHGSGADIGISALRTRAERLNCNDSGFNVKYGRRFLPT